jgi:hypothetical protein
MSSSKYAKTPGMLACLTWIVKAVGCYLVLASRISPLLLLLIRSLHLAQNC